MTRYVVLRCMHQNEGGLQPLVPTPLDMQLGVRTPLNLYKWYSAKYTRVHISVTTVYIVVSCFTFMYVLQRYLKLNVCVHRISAVSQQCM